MFRIAVLLIVAVALAPLSGVYAHGEYDAELDELHEHIDDYRAEVERLIGEAEAIVETHRKGGDAAAMVPALIDSWEDVGIHGAIELHASLTYPGVWQGIVGLQEAVESDADTDRVQAAADELAAALWQGLGAVRLVASRVESGEFARAPNEPPEGDTGEQIAHIQDELKQAVAAYDDGDLERAEKLIHGAYMQRFEFLEGGLIAQDAALVEDLEMDFNARLPQLMRQGADLDAVRAKLHDMLADLDRAGQLLTAAEAARGNVF